MLVTKQAQCHPRKLDLRLLKSDQSPRRALIVCLLPKFGRSRRSYPRENVPDVQRGRTLVQCEESDVTMRFDRQFLVSALVAVLVMALAPSSANAAWWNFGKKSNSESVAVSPTGSVVLAQLSEGAPERFNRVEAQMRTLTGQVEQLMFQLNQLQAQLKLMQEDNEFRFRDLEGGTSSATQSDRPADRANALPPSLPPPDAGGQSDPIGTIAEQGLPQLGGLQPGGSGAPQLSLGAPAQPSFGGSGQPLDLSAPLPPAPGQGGAQTAALAPTGDSRMDFERAYQKILTGDYDSAEVGLRQFLAAYPEDPRAADARYWLGESLFSRARYQDAANEFHATYKTYPNSSRAPDALFKLGLSLAGFGQRETACATFASVLKQFPDASNVLQQKVSFEQASAGC